MTMPSCLLLPTAAHSMPGTSDAASGVRQHAPQASSCGFTTCATPQAHSLPPPRAQPCAMYKPGSVTPLPSPQGAESGSAYRRLGAASSVRQCCRYGRFWLDEGLRSEEQVADGVCVGLEASRYV
jgi:hypothetical protein